MNARFLLAPAALLCATATIAAAVPANAGPFQARSSEVSYADLDLATATGRATLERRVLAAAKNVCRAKGSSDLASIRAANACLDETLDQAMGKVQVAVNAAVQYAGLRETAGDR